MAESDNTENMENIDEVNLHSDVVCQNEIWDQRSMKQKSAGRYGPLFHDWKQF